MAVDDSNTVSLLHFEGADGSPTITDESGKTWTASGNAQLDTAQFKFGTSSLLLDGNGDYVSTPDHNDFNFGTGKLTIDLRVRYLSTANSQMICSQVADMNNMWYLFKSSEQKLSLNFRSGGVDKANISTQNAYSFLNNVWYHLAFVRDGGTCYIGIDGIMQSLTEYVPFGTNDVGNVAAPFEIGRYNLGTYLYHNGWFDEFRASKGVARWTADFTPPVGPYGSNTKKILGVPFGYVKKLSGVSAANIKKAAGV